MLESKMTDALRAPVLETERLTLRGHVRGDLAECAAMWADPVVVRHIGGRPFSEEETWARLLRYVGHWALLGFGYWIVRERESGRFLGEVGFADYRRAIEPSFDGTPEIGWALATWAHGKGLATEAVRAVVRWGDDHLEAARTLCIVDEGHMASLRVADKCGYREVSRTVYKGSPTVVLQRPRAVV